MSQDAAINSMFGRIADFYDPLNHILSLGIDKRWRSALAAKASPGSHGLIVDLAAGTLDVSRKLAIRWPDARICALDFCAPMLKRGLRKIGRLHINPCVADARRMPLPDNMAGSLTIAFGIRNIHPRAEAFREMLRVLEPGGHALILEFGSARERIWGGLYNFYLARLLPNIGKLIARDKAAYEYLARTVREFPVADELAGEMRAAGFESVAYSRLTGGIVCLHSGVKPKNAAAEGSGP